MIFDLRFKHKNIESWLEVMAWWISGIFSPIMLVPGMFLYLILNNHFTSDERIKALLIIFGTGVLPVFLTLLVLKQKKYISDWNISVRSERHKFNILVIIFGLVTCALLWIFSLPNFAHFFSVIVVWMMLFSLVTYFWKISAHMIVLTYFVMIINLEGMNKVSLLILLLIPFVGWARIYRKQHTLAQVAGGVLFSVITLSGTIIIINYFI